MKKMLTFLITLALTIMPVHAVCSFKEKSEPMTKASNVKVDYEVVEDKQEYEGGTVDNEYFKISILNITEDLYVVVSNDITNEEVTYTFNDVKDGIITFNWEHNEEITNFTFKIYASDKTQCNGEELKTIRKQTPRYNDFYNRAICQDMKDFYLCQKYTTVKNIDESMFIEKVDNFMLGEIDEDGKETENKKPENKILQFINDYKWYLVGGAVVIVIGVTSVIVLKRKKSDLVK